MAIFSKIQEFLKKKGVQFTVIEQPETAISLDDVLRLTNGQVKEQEIVKTLIGKMKNDEFKAFVLKGRDRLDVQKMQNFGRLATKEEVSQIAEVEPGAVCAIQLGIPIIIDSKVIELTKVNMGSGDHLKGLEMDLSDFLESLPSYSVETIV